ncbi:MAG: spore coat protein U domain-containing protein [Myxococcota bacterium]
MRLILSLCLAAGLLLPDQAGAECGRIRLLNMDPVDWRGGGGGYDVFDATQHIQPVEIRVRKTRGGTCRYKIGTSEGSSGLFDPRQLVRRGQRLAYNLYDTAAQTNIVTDLALGGTVIEGQFTDASAGTETNTHTYYWVIPPRQMVAGAHGRYSDRLRFRLYEEVGGVYVQRNAQSRRHRTRAPRQVEISLVDTGAPFNANDVSQKLDFGIFSEGRMQGFDLRVRGNTGFRVSLQSANQGVMAHDALRSAVPYTCTVDGVPVDLNRRGAAQIASFTADATVAEGAVYRIEVTVGSLAGTLGGRHRDSVTVTLMAR